MYDAIIVGGSFAGLATAMQLRGHRMLLIDQYPIGSHQTSTCGMPLATIRAVGGEAAILEEHDALIAHAGGRELRYPMRMPYVTFDYHALCQAMLARTDAEVWEARATEAVPGWFATTRGTAGARFVIDASGWRSAHWRGPQPASPPQLMGYGVETELPTRPALSPGLHVFFERRIVRNGYAWVFPCGQTTRFGVGTFDRGGRCHRSCTPSSLASAFGPARPVAVCWRSSAGNRWPANSWSWATLPGSACPSPPRASAPRFSMGASPAGSSRRHSRARSPPTKRAHYRASVRRTARFQHLAAHTPDLLRAVLGRLNAHPAIFHPAMRRYPHASGWVR